ncbi:unnamed protein product [Bathycoccus prasinos]
MNLTRLDKEILTFGGKVTGMFINVVSSGSKNNEFEWVEQFIDKYQDELTESDRTSIVNLSGGLLNYYKKDYESAENYLIDFRIAISF